MNKKVSNLIIVISTLVIIVLRFLTDPLSFQSEYISFSVSIDFFKIAFGMGLLIILFKESVLSIIVSIVFASIMIGVNISHIEIPIIILLLVLSVLDKKIEYVWFMICFVFIIIIKLFVYNDIMLDSSLSKFVIDFAHIALILGLIPIDIRAHKDEDIIDERYNFISIKRFKYGVLLIAVLFSIVSVVLFIFVKDDHQVIDAFRQIESQYEEKLCHTFDFSKENVSLYILESWFPEVIVIRLPEDLAEDDMDSKVKFAYQIRDSYIKFKEKWYDENIYDKGNSNLSKILDEDFRITISFGNQGLTIFGENAFGEDAYLYKGQFYDY